MAALDPRELLIRAAVSAVAGAVSTTVIVKTADSAQKRKRRARRGKKGKGKKGKKKSTTTALVEAEKRADTPGRRANAELGELPGPGLSVDEFLANVKAVPGRVGDLVTGAFSRKEPPPDDEAGEKKRGKRREKKKDGFETLKEEALFVAKTAVKDKIKETTGLGTAIDAVEKGTEAVKSAAEKVKEKISESVPEDLSEKVADAGRAISEGGKRIGRAVSEAIPDDAEDVEALKEKLDGSLHGLTRWIEGPGAPDYRRRGTEDTDPARRPKIVDARLRDDEDAAETASSEREQSTDEPSSPDPSPSRDVTAASRDAPADDLDPTAALKRALDASADAPGDDDDRAPDAARFDGPPIADEPDPEQAAPTRSPPPPRAEDDDVVEPKEGRPAPHRPILRGDEGRPSGPPRGGPPKPRPRS